MPFRLSRRARVNLLVFLGAILFCLVAAELVLRAVGYANPNHHRPDIQRGWFPWESLDSPLHTGRLAHLSYNEDGIRGGPVARQAPKDVFRIAVMGDSFTEALDIAYKDTFVALLEAGLKSCPALGGRVPQTVNFGVSGYGTHQSLLDYRLRVRRFSPDLVVLVVFPGNDIANNSPILDGNRKRPYFALRDETLVAPTPADTWSVFWRSLKARAYNAVRLFQFIEESRRAIKYGLFKGRRAESVGERQAQKEDWVLAPARDDAWHEAWALTTALLTALKRDVEVEGSAFAVALVSVPQQVHPDESLRQRLADELGVEDLLYPNRRLAAWAKKAQATLIDPLAALQQEVARSGAFLHGFKDDKGGSGFGHYNALGHAAFARAVSPALCGHPGLFSGP